jgi:hypothetical protein
MFEITPWNQRRLTSALMVLVLTSCTKPSTSTDADIGSMAGTWRQECTTNDNNTPSDSSDDFDMMQLLTISGDQFNSTFSIWTSRDGSCSGSKQAELTATGVLVKGAGSVAVSGAFALDIATRTAKIRKFNSSALGAGFVQECAGVGSSVDETDYDVTNSGCSALPGTTEFSIAKVDATSVPQRLQLGQVADADNPSTPNVDESLFDASSAEKRPLDLGAVLLKQ